MMFSFTSVLIRRFLNVLAQDTSRAITGIADLAQARLHDSQLRHLHPQINLYYTVDASTDQSLLHCGRAGARQSTSTADGMCVYELTVL